MGNWESVKNFSRKEVNFVVPHEKAELFNKLLQKGLVGPNTTIARVDAELFEDVDQYILAGDQNYGYVFDGVDRPPLKNNSARARCYEVSYQDHSIVVGNNMFHLHRRGNPMFEKEEPYRFSADMEREIPMVVNTCDKIEETKEEIFLREVRSLERTSVGNDDVTCSAGVSIRHERDSVSIACHGDWYGSVFMEGGVLATIPGKVIGEPLYFDADNDGKKDLVFNVELAEVGAIQMYFKGI